MSDEKQILTLEDFAFLNGDRIHKMEVRFNENTSQSCFLTGQFRVNKENKNRQNAKYEEDYKNTIIVFSHKGKNMTECLIAMHKWYNGFYQNVKVFDVLTDGGDNASE